MPKSLHQHEMEVDFCVSSAATTWKALAAQTRDALVEAIHSQSAIHRNLIPHRIVVLISPGYLLSGEPLPPLAELPGSLARVRVEFHRRIADASKQCIHQIHFYLRNSGPPAKCWSNSDALKRIPPTKHTWKGDSS